MKKALHRNGLVAQFSYAIQIVVMLFYPALALAGPDDPSVVGGSATVTQPDANTTIVQQTSDRAVINWRGFSIDVNELVEFQQPGAEAIALNRVTGNTPSEIFGSLIANGRVFVVNPNGVVFGPGSHVDVAGLVATTFNINNDDFMNGNLSFQQDPNAALKAIVNQGEIKVDDNGFVFLVAPAVSNEGLIIAKLGQVTLGAGSSLKLDFNGDGLVSYQVDGKVLDQVTGPDGSTMRDAVANKGTIQANGGTVVLHADAAGAVFDSLVNNEGVIEAQSLSGSGGVVRLEGSSPVDFNGLGAENNRGRVDATEGVVLNTGEIDVAAIEAGAQGGTVVLSGAYVGVSGSIDAQGGGNVLIASSVQTVLTSSASVNVSGSGSGDAGQAVVWSDTYTQFYGSILGRGGDAGGDGGNVEVSGHSLVNRGTVDLRAPGGTMGTLLLDPLAVLVHGAGVPTDGDDVLDVNGATFTPLGGPGIMAFVDPPQDGFEPYDIYETEIEGQSALSNIEIRAQQNFATDAAATFIGASVLLALNSSLTIEVDGTVAAGTITTDVPFLTQGTGSITVNGATVGPNATDITVNPLGGFEALGTGNVTLDTNVGNITVNGLVFTSANGSTLSINSAGFIAVGATGTVSAGGLGSTTAALNMTAVGTITDVAGSAIAATGQATIVSTGSDITLNDSEAFGSLNFSGVNVLISENDNLNLTGANTATGTLTLTSETDSITDAAATTLSATGNAVLNSAAGSIVLGNEGAPQSYTFLANATFTASGDISLGENPAGTDSGATMNFLSLSFSATNVSIFEDSATDLVDATGVATAPATLNAGNNLLLVSTGAITDQADTDVTVGGNSVIRTTGAGAAITLANNAADTYTFGFNSTFQSAGGNIFVGSDGSGTFTDVASTVTLGTLSFDTGATGGNVEMFIDSAIILADSDGATTPVTTLHAQGTLYLDSVPALGTITDAVNTDMTVTGNAVFVADGGINLADNALDSYVFSAHVGFNSSATPNNIFVGSNGAAADSGATFTSASLSFTGLNVEIFQDAATVLSDDTTAGTPAPFAPAVNTATGTLLLSSTGTVTDNADTDVAVTLAGQIRSTTSSITLGNSAGDSYAFTNQATFTAVTDIFVGVDPAFVPPLTDSTAVVNFGSLLFNSSGPAGNVRILEDSGMGLVDGSTAFTAALGTTAGDITDFTGGGAGVNFTGTSVFFGSAGGVGTGDQMEINVTNLEATAAAGLIDIVDTAGQVQLNSWFTGDNVSINATGAVSIAGSGADSFMTVRRDVISTTSTISLAIVPGSPAGPSGDQDIYIGDGVEPFPLMVQTDGYAPVLVQAAVGSAITILAEDDIIVNQDAILGRDTLLNGNAPGIMISDFGGADGIGAIFVVSDPAGTSTSSPLTGNPGPISTFVDPDILQVAGADLHINDPIIATVNITATARRIFFNEADGFIRTTGSITLTATGAVGFAGVIVDNFLAPNDAELELIAPTIVLNAAGGTAGFPTPDADAIDLDVSTGDLTAVVAPNGALTDGSGSIRINDVWGQTNWDVTADALPGLSLRRIDTFNGDIFIDTTDLAAFLPDLLSAHMIVMAPTFAAPTQGVVAGSGALAAGNGNVVLRTVGSGNIQLGDATGLGHVGLADVTAFGDTVSIDALFETVAGDRVLAGSVGSITDVDPNGYDNAVNRINVRATNAEFLAFVGVGRGISTAGASIGNSLLEVDLFNPFGTSDPRAAFGGNLSGRYGATVGAFGGGFLMKNFASTGLIIPSAIVGSMTTLGVNQRATGIGSGPVNITGNDAAFIIMADMVSAAAIVLTNPESAALDVDDHIIVDTDTEIVSTGSSVLLRAGDDVQLNAGAGVAGATTTGLVAGFGDNDFLGGITVTSGANPTFIGFDDGAGSGSGVPLASTTVSLTAPNDITFTDAAASIANVTSTGVTTITAGTDGSGNLQLSSVTAGSLNARAAGTITDLTAGASAIAVTGLATFIATDGFGTNFDVTLGDAAAETVNFGSLNVTGANVAVTEDSAMVVAGITANGTLALTAVGAGGETITQTGAINVTGATTLTAVGDDITLNNIGNSFGGTVTVTDGVNVTLNDTNALDLGGNTTALTSLTVTANGDITDSGNLLVTGAMTVNSGAFDVTLNDANILASFGVTNARNVSVEVGALDLDGLVLNASTISGNLVVNTNLSGAGAITQTGAVTVAGTTTLTAGLTGAIDLSTFAGNAFNIVSVVSSASVIMDDDSGNLEVTTIASAGAVTLFTNGAITDGNAGANNVTAPSLSATAGSGIDLDTTITTLTLASVTGAGNVDINDAGTLAITTVTTANGNVTIASGDDMTIGSITAGGASSLVTLTSASDIDDVGDGADVTAARFVAISVDGVGDTDGLDTNVRFFEAAGGTGGIALANTGGALTVGGIGAVASIAATGAITISAASPLTVAMNMTTAGAIALTAGETGALGDNLTLNLGVVVQSTASSVSLTAGDDVVFGGVINSFLAATVTAGAGDAGEGGSVVNANGTLTDITAPSLTISAVGVTAANGIDVDTAITTLTAATVTGVGGIDVSDIGGGLTVTAALTADGGIAISGTAGAMVVTSAIAGGTGGVSLNNVGGATTLTFGSTTDGDIVVNGNGGLVTVTTAVAGGMGSIEASSTGAGLTLFTATTANGDIVANANGGALSMAVGGGIIGAGGTGDILASTEGGALTIEDAFALDGDIVVDGNGGLVSLATAVGSTVFAAGNGEIIASSTGGGLTMGLAGGLALVFTANGDITANANGGTLTLAAVGAGGVGNVSGSTTNTFNIEIDSVTSALDVSLSSGGTINEIGAGDAGNDIVATSASLVANAGIGTAGSVEVDVTTLTLAQTNFGGLIDVNDTAGGMNVLTAVTLGGGAITLAAAGGNLGIGTLVAGGGSAATLTVTGAGAIFDLNGGDTNVTADTLTATAIDGIDLDVQVNTVAAATTTNGDVNINDLSGGVTVTTATTGVGNVILNAENGDLTVTTATATTGDVILTNSNGVLSATTATTTTGNVTVTAQSGAVVLGTASTTTGNVSVTAQNGAITATTLTTTTGNVTVAGENGDATITTASAGTGNVTVDVTNGALVIATIATAGTGNVDLNVTDGDLTVTTASTTVAGSVSLQATNGAILATTLSAAGAGGGIDVVGNGSGAVTVTTATTADGAIAISAENDDLTVTTVTAGGVGNNVDLATIGTGDITLGLATAAGDTVTINAAGAVIDGNGDVAGDNVAALNLILTGGEGVGAGNAIETAVTNLAGSGGTGEFNLSNTGVPLVSGLTIDVLGGVVGVSAQGAITIVSGSPLTVNATVASAGDVLLQADESGDNANFDQLTINANVTGHNITLNAGDDVIVNDTVEAQENLAINAGDGVYLNDMVFAGELVTITTGGAVFGADDTAVTCPNVLVMGPGAGIFADDIVITVFGDITLGILKAVDTVTVTALDNAATPAEEGNIFLGAGFTEGKIIAGMSVTLTADVSILFQVSVTAPGDPDAFINAGSRLTMAADANANGTGAIADTEADVLTVADILAPVVFATAGAGIAYDGQVDSLLNATTTTGAVNITDIDDLVVGTVTTSAADTVSLTVGGAIMDANGAGTNNVTALNLVATTGAGVNLDTVITAGGSLTASVSGDGDLDIRNASGGLLNLLSATVAGSGDVTVTNNEAMVSTIAAATNGDVTLTATAGNLTSAFATSGQGNVNLTSVAGDLFSTTATSGQGNVTLTAGDDLASTTATSTQGNVTLTAATTLTSVTATSGNGNVELTAGTTLTSTTATSANGNVGLTAGTTLTSTTASSVDGNVDLTAGTDLTSGLASATDGNANLTATTGFLTSTTVLTTNGNANLTSGTTLTSTTVGVTNGGANLTSGTTLTSDTVTTTNGDAVLTAGTTLTATTTTTANGDAIFSGTAVTLTNVTAGGAGAGDGSVIATATTGDILLDVILALGDSVSLTAAGAINELPIDGANEIVADSALLSGAAGVGTTSALEMDVETLSGRFATGGFFVTDTAGGLTVGTVAGVAGVVDTALGDLDSITIVALSPLTIAANVTGAGTVTLTATEDAVLPFANDDNLTINADATVSSSAANVVLSAGDNIDIFGFVNAAAGATTLTAGAGDNDGLGSVVNVLNGLSHVILTGGTLDVDAVGNNGNLGINLDTTASTIDADVSGTTTGGIRVNNVTSAAAPTVTFTSPTTAADTGDGSISLANTGGAMTVTSVTTSATTGNGDITVSQDGSTLLVTALTAATTSGTADVVIEGSGGLTTVTAASATATAAGGSASMDITTDTGLTVTTASTSASTGDASMSITDAGGALTVVTSLTTTATSGDASLTINQSGGATTIASATTNATSGVGTMDIDTAGGTLTVTTAATNVTSGDGTMNISGDGGAVTVTTATATATTGDADVNITATSAGLTATTISAVGDDADITLTTTGAPGDGNVNIDTLTAAGDRVTIDSTGAIVDDEAGTNDITALELVAVSDTGVGTASPLDTTVSFVEGTGGTGVFSMLNNGALTIGITANSAQTGVTAAGNIDIETNGAGAPESITVSENVESTGANVTLVAIETAGAGFADDVFVDPFVTVTSADDLTITAGDDIVIAGMLIFGANGGAASTTVLTAGAGDLDTGGSIVDLNGGAENLIGLAAASDLIASAVGANAPANGLAIDLDTRITTVTAATVGTTVGGVQLGGIRIEDTQFGLTVNSATTESGSITLSATGGDLAIAGTGVTAGTGAAVAGNGNIILNTFTGMGAGGVATSGDITLGVVGATTLVALGDLVELNSVSSVLDAQADGNPDGTPGTGTLLAAETNITAQRLLVHATDGFGTAAERVETRLTEDLDLDGVLDAGEDVNGNGILDGVAAGTFDQVGWFQTNAGALIVGSVTSVGGVTTAGIRETDVLNDGGATADITIQTLSPLFIVNDLLAAGDILLIADETADAPFGNDDVRIGEDINGNGLLDAGEDVNGNGFLDTFVIVKSTLGSIEVQAGDDIFLALGSTLEAFGSVALHAGFDTDEGDLDGIGSATILGSINPGVPPGGGGPGSVGTGPVIITALGDIILGLVVAPNGLIVFTEFGNILDGNGPALNIQANGLITLTAVRGVIGLDTDAIEIEVQAGQVVANAGGSADRVSINLNGDIEPDGRFFSSQTAPGLELFNNSVLGGDGIDEVTDRFFKYTSDRQIMYSGERDHGMPGFYTFLMFYIGDDVVNPEVLYQWDASIEAPAGK